MKAIIVWTIIWCMLWIALKITFTKIDYCTISNEVDIECIVNTPSTFEILKELIK
jgi:hypothetical protein